MPSARWESQKSFHPLQLGFNSHAVKARDCETKWNRAPWDIRSSLLGRGQVLSARISSMSAVFSGPFGSNRISFLSCYIFSSISSRRSRMRREGTDQFEQSLGYYQGIRRPGLENPWFRQQAEVAYCWIWRPHLQFPIISNRTHEYGMKRLFLLVAAMPVHSWDKHCRKSLDSEILSTRESGLPPSRRPGLLCPLDGPYMPL